MRLLLLGVVLAGCGIGINRSYRSAHIGPDRGFAEFDPATFPHYGTHDVDLWTTEITLYDRTGLLFAGVGTAGNRYTAEQEAVEQAVERGAETGDTVEYEYETVPPVPGNTTQLTFGWGSTDEWDHTLLDGTRVRHPDPAYPGQEVSLFLLDVRARLGNWQLGPVNLGLPLGVTALLFTVPSNEGINSVSMPFGADASYELAGPVVVSARLLGDPLVGGFVALLGQPKWFWGEAGARVDVRPLSWLAFFVDGVARIVGWEWERAGHEYAATGGLALLWKWDEGLAGAFAPDDA
jgi:hypothetical protein